MLRATLLRPRSSRMLGVLCTLVAMTAFVGSSTGQETPGEDLQETQSEATEEFQSQADEPQEAIDQQLEQQEEQIDQQLDQQQDELNQQLDQAEDQVDQQQDNLNNELDQAEDQADRQQDELNQQIDRTQNQIDEQQNAANQQLDQAEGQLDADAAVDADAQAEAEGQVNLGVTVDESAAVTEGISIGEILADSAAATAGLRRGDVILSIDGQSITRANQLDQFLRGRTAGDALDFIVLRNGRRQPMTVTFEERHFHYHPRGTQYGQDFRNTDQHGWLGVTLQRDDPFARQPGVGIASVVPRGPAARAGIQQGDRILEFRREQVSSMDHLLGLLSRTSPGDRIELLVISNGSEQSLTAVLGDASLFNGVAQAGSSYRPERSYESRQSNYRPTGTEHDMLLEQHQQLVEQQQRMESVLRQLQADVAAIQRQLDMQSTSGTFEHESLRQQSDSDQTQDSQQLNGRPVAPGRESLPPGEERPPTDGPPNPQ